MQTEDTTRHIEAYADSVRNANNMLGMLEMFGVDEEHGTHQFDGTPLEELGQDIENDLDFFHYWINYNTLEATVICEERITLGEWFNSESRNLEPVSVELLIAYGGPSVRLTVPVHAQLPAKRPLCGLRLDWWGESATMTLELPHLQAHIAEMMSSY